MRTRERVPVAVDVIVNRARRAHTLFYLTRPGEEVRSWDLTQLVPLRKWQQLLNPELDLSASRTVSIVSETRLRQALAAYRSLGAQTRGERAAAVSPASSGAVADVADRPETSPGSERSSETAALVSRLTVGASNSTAGGGPSTLACPGQGDKPAQSSPAGERTPRPSRLCVGCGQWFVPRRSAQRHCKGACRAEAARQRERRRIARLFEHADPWDPGRPE